MPLQPGTPLGPYEILSPIGAGGMGEVYKARDTRLDRTVAIKVLPEHVAADPDLKQRFEREAKTISSLNHPHICTLHDIGNQDGVDFLVMEYLDGETLAQRLEKGALPLDQALQVAIEIADALDKAHRQGITHRDLKPGNIMLTKAGAKLLDFGLAKLKPGHDAPVGVSAPTVSAGLTGEGAILGTLQYMAPEQLEGEEADERTDIFAFGVVVYEMVTGRKAFDGKSQASLIAAILEREPPAMSALQALSPPVLDRVVMKCLAKEPDARWQTASDLQDELQWINDGGSQVAVPAVVATPRKTREWVAWATAAALALVATALVALHVNQAPSEDGTTRFSVLTASGVVTGLALSPDGTQLAFVTGAAFGQLWIRPRDSITAQAVPGADRAYAPFWSPDGRSIGFFTGSELKTVDLAGGPPRTVCPVSTPNGGTWNQDDVIVFGRGTGGLSQVEAAGGEPIPLSTLDVPGALFNSWPQFLPDGEHVLFLATTLEAGGPENGIYVGSLEPGTTSSFVVQANAMARYAAPGYLLFGRGGALMAQPFDLEQLAVTGDPVRVVDEVAVDEKRGLGFSTSDQGGLVHLGATGSTLSQLRWVDRAGGELGTVGAPGDYRNPVLSPDESRIAVERDSDIWLLDLARGTDQRFTFAPELDLYPVWSPDGERLVFASFRDGRRLDLFEKGTGGASEAHLLLETNFIKVPIGWSADGAFVSYVETNDTTGFDLWLHPVSGDRQPMSYLRTPSLESGLLSPDGRWMAYYSDESGEYRVYVQRVPPAGPVQISTGDGRMPRWKADGRELYYVTADNHVMAVDIDATGDAPILGIPHPLFELPFRLTPNPRNVYDVTADGERFLVNTLVEGAISAPITWVLNWAAGLGGVVEGT